MEPYLKDKFAVQGTFLSSDCFLILTEGTIYIYESEKVYNQGEIPQEILNLKMYKIQIAQKEGKVLTLVNIKNQEKQYVFYSNRREQIDCWYNMMKKWKEQYEQFLQNVNEQKINVVPFEMMDLKYSIDLKNDSLDSALIQQ
ncbi:unnamed protein product [Paramecium pentaurelia]|uniref:PH domain-containing protein n=1 Tax=Paramecium pentaurelia TaxID=43138 RepID=A0A8S1US76_9CILI|nr:unnamed protein product [Paramecium pentaurelia]